MNVTVEIPDELAERLSSAGGDLSRRALEAFALEEFKSGRLTKPELRRLLGYETRAALDGFLKAHAVVHDLPTIADLEQERRDLKSLGMEEEHPGPPFKTGWGLLAKYGPAPSAEEIDENRREIFRGFVPNVP
jgi:hypothetical protein